MVRRSANCQVMIKAAMRAARGLIHDFGEVEQLQVSLKGPGDFVSLADKKAEQTIFEELQRVRPEFGFIMEESGSIKAKDGASYWIIDPLDGTSNFVHGLPHFAISIALQQRGELVSALVLDPLRNELFTADKGGGAYLNDRRIRVSGRNDFSQSLIACGLPVQNWKGREKGFTAQMECIADRCGGLRRLGAASLDLAYVAAGRQDGYWEYGLKPWDMAAGILLIREAGGRASLLENEQDILSEGTIVAGNPKIFSTLSSILK